MDDACCNGISQALRFLQWIDVASVARASLKLQALVQTVVSSNREDISRPTIQDFRVWRNAVFVSSHLSTLNEHLLPPRTQPFLDRSRFFFVGENEEPQTFISHQQHHIEIQKMIELAILLCESQQQEDSGAGDPSLLSFLTDIKTYLSYWVVVNSPVCDAGFLTAVWERQEPTSASYFVLNIKGLHQSLYIGMYFSTAVEGGGRRVSEHITTTLVRSPFEPFNLDEIQEELAPPAANNSFIFSDFGRSSRVTLLGRLRPFVDENNNGGETGSP
uniref:Uncharacterized protein n=1 Tax=Heterosigma akashiwo TaxID=2829 RepID=A0A6V1NCZ9_HETAK|mmetsp:Transcript_39224/g.64596  ORF Transcript_39224/g.64596 Transcript_39224/m.64596 type:complete len:274 (+) Transcript_39224:112-933(+)